MNENAPDLDKSWCTHCWYRMWNMFRLSQWIIWVNGRKFCKSGETSFCLGYSKWIANQKRALWPFYWDYIWSSSCIHYPDFLSMIIFRGPKWVWSSREKLKHNTDLNDLLQQGIVTCECLSNFSWNMYKAPSQCILNASTLCFLLTLQPLNGPQLFILLPVVVLVLD